MRRYFVKTRMMSSLLDDPLDTIGTYAAEKSLAPR